MITVAKNFKRLFLVNERLLNEMRLTLSLSTMPDFAFHRPFFREEAVDV